ncbi:ATP-grasp domain-containing protein [Candidatus Uhrbacteria bacterium]|nr:ATP-grasp domain-containing protein [Candidatus Uhrbacteria bacterium]
MKKIRIGIIFGGKSSEKEVSLNSGRNIYNVMDRGRFEPIPLFMDAQAQFWKLPIQLVVQNTTEDIAARLAEAQRVRFEDLKTIIDLAFPITFGSYGEDGCLQGLLTLLGIPYIGSDVLAAALGQDKSMQRVLMAHQSTINIPPYIVITSTQIQSSPNLAEQIIALFGLPLVVKPARGGSTIGVEIVDSTGQWGAAVSSALQHDNRIVIEPWITGLEFSCVVMETANGPQALQPTETVHQDRLFSYHEKYMPGAANKITPARVSAARLQEVQHMCVDVFTTLGFKGYARIDGFVLTKELSIQPSTSKIQDLKFYVPAPYPAETILITDPNVYSGMAPSSWAFHQAAHEEWGPTEFMTKLIETTNFKPETRNPKPETISK